MFARVVGGLRPAPPSNEPASGPSAPPWPWQGGQSFFFFFFSPVALASAIMWNIPADIRSKTVRSDLLTLL